MKKLFLLLLFLLPLFVLAQAPIKTVKLTANEIYFAAPTLSSKDWMMVVDTVTGKAYVRRVSDLVSGLTIDTTHFLHSSDLLWQYDTDSVLVNKNVNGKIRIKTVEPGSASDNLLTRTSGGDIQEISASTISTQWYEGSEVLYYINKPFVGIGTSNPTTALTVVGTTMVDDLTVNADANVFGSLEVADSVYLPPVITSPKSFSAVSDFTMVFIGDMHQVIPTNNWSIAANSITRWIKAHKVDSNIVAVMVGGDISNEDAEWVQAIKGFDTLAVSGIPYIASMGNHDYTDLPTRDRTGWNTNLPVSRFSDETWYGGVHNSTTANMFIKFSVGSDDFLILSLEILPEDAVLTWADSVVTANFDRKVIICTHYFLKYTGLRATSAYSDLGVAGNNPTQVWDEFVKNHENIIMVVNGHDVGGIGSAKLVSVGDSGNIVNQIYNNYQETTTGDMVTEIMLLNFSPSSGTINTTAYATLTNTVDTIGNYHLPYTPSVFNMDLRSTENVLASGDISAAGVITADRGVQTFGDISSSSGLNIGANARIDSVLTVKGETKLDSNATVKYDLTVKKDLYVDSTANITGDLNAYDDVNISNDLFVEDTVRIKSLKQQTSVSLDLYATTAPTMRLKSYGVVPSIRFFRINGSISTPTATTTGQAIGSIQGCGHNGTSETLNRAQFGMTAAEDWTSTNNGAYAWIGTTGIGTTNQVERIRITDAGNVGINTTNPTATLHVASKSASAPQFRTYTSVLGEASPTDSLGLYVDPTGKVGVGTTAPTSPLHVVGAIYGTTTITGISNIQTNQYTSATTADLKISSRIAKSILFETEYGGTASEKMRITPSGVGIGTTNPQAKLHIKDGAIRAGVIAYATIDSTKMIAPKFIATATDTTGVGSTANVGSMMYYNGHFYGLVAGSPPAWKQLDAP